MYIFLSILIFTATWYDTTHAHLYTTSLNNLIQNLAAPQTGFYHESLTLITHLGNNLVFVIAIGLLCLYLFKKRNMKVLWSCLISTVIVIGMTMVFKHIIDSPRPFPFSASHDSFPSGHVMRVTLWCGLFLLANKLKSINLPRIAYYALFIIPILVGLSRLGLSKHWFSDIIGAYALTIGILLTTYKLQGKRQ